MRENRDPCAKMPLAQISEPWPTMELVQLEQEVPGEGGVGRVEGFEMVTNHFSVRAWSRPGVHTPRKVVRRFDFPARTFRELARVKELHTRRLTRRDLGRQSSTDVRPCRLKVSRFYWAENTFTHDKVDRKSAVF